jgi:histone demethylase JARID1
MELDTGGGMHSNFFMPDGSGPQLLADSNLGLSLEDRLLHGRPDGPSGPGGDLHVSLLTGSGKQKALEIMSRTEHGRRKAEEIWGPGVWDNKGPLKSSLDHSEDVDAGDGADVDRMFVEMTNQDDDDDSGGRGHNGGDHHITAESLESERNGMDALLDGE